MVCAECQALSRLSCCELNFEPFTVKYFKPGRDVRAHPGLKSLQGHVLTTCCTLELQGLPGRPAGDRPQAVVVVTDEDKRVIVPVTHKSNLIKYANEAQRWAASLPIWKLMVMRAQGFEYEYTPAAPAARRDKTSHADKKKKRKKLGNNWAHFEEDEFVGPEYEFMSEDEEEEEDEDPESEASDEKEEKPEDEDEDDDCLLVEVKKKPEKLESRKRKKHENKDKDVDTKRAKKENAKELKKLKKELELAKQELAKQQREQAELKKVNTKACSLCSDITRQHGFKFVEDMKGALVYLNPNYYNFYQMSSSSSSSSSSSNSSSVCTFYKCCMFRKSEATGAVITGFTATHDQARKSNRVFVPRCQPLLDTDERGFDFSTAQVFPPRWALELVHPKPIRFGSELDDALKGLGHGPGSLPGMRAVWEWQDRSRARLLTGSSVDNVLMHLRTKRLALAENPSCNLLSVLAAHVSRLRDLNASELPRFIAEQLQLVSFDCDSGCFRSVKYDTLTEALAMGYSQCQEVKFVQECMLRVEKDPERARVAGWTAGASQDQKKKVIDALLRNRVVALPSCPRPHLQTEWLQRLLRDRAREEVSTARIQADELVVAGNRVKELEASLRKKGVALEQAYADKERALRDKEQATRDKEQAKSKAAKAVLAANGYKLALDQFKSETARSLLQGAQTDAGAEPAKPKSSTVLWTPEFWGEVFASYEQTLTYVVKPYVPDVQSKKLTSPEEDTNFLTHDLLRNSVAWALFSCLAMPEMELRVQLAQAAKARNEEFDVEQKLECLICMATPATGKMLQFCPRCHNYVLCLRCAVRPPRPHQCATCRFSLYKCHNMATTYAGVQVPCSGNDLRYQGEKVFCGMTSQVRNNGGVCCSSVLLDAEVLRNQA